MSVVGLKGEEIVGPQGFNVQCVERIEKLLQMAKDGEIVGVAASLFSTTMEQRVTGLPDIWVFVQFSEASLA